ncbi:MAG: hypothetical protein LQ341_007533, partial [Variospora aurantia]
VWFQAKVLAQSAVSVCVEVKVKQSRQGKGKLLQDFLTQALQGAVGAFASAIALLPNLDTTTDNC